VRPEYWAFLESLPRAAVVVPEGPEGRLEPLAALYGRESLPAVEAALQEGLRSLGGWHDYLGRYGLARTVVPFSVVEKRFGRAIFANINRPQDWPADQEPL
jgi:molybdopterin-guanine dinucleotide biosynthesis protein A